MKAHRLSSNTRWKFYTFIVLQLQQLLLEKSESKNKKESGYGPYEKLCVLKKFHFERNNFERNKMFKNWENFVQKIEIHIYENAI